jgi:hypothetical protein
MGRTHHCAHVIKGTSKTPLVVEECPNIIYDNLSLSGSAVILSADVAAYIAHSPLPLRIFTSNNNDANIGFWLAPIALKRIDRKDWHACVAASRKPTDLGRVVSTDKTSRSAGQLACAVVSYP